MKILVTGANGLLGHHVVTQLLSNHHDVNIVVRSTVNIHFDLKKVNCVQGNFTDKETMIKAISGCDAVIHIAAVTDMNICDYQTYHTVNVEATKQLLEIAKEYHIKSFIYVSSANTIGYGNKGSLAAENLPFAYPFTKSHYAKSKFEAEKIVRNYAHFFHAIIINPTFMIGSYDTKPSSGQLVLMAYKKPLLLIPSGGKNFVAVEDVATACCNALTMGKSGENYLAAYINLSFKDYFQLQKTIGNYRQCMIVLPDIFMKLIGYFGDLLVLLKIKVSFHSRNINQLLINEYYTYAKAKKELLMPETPVENAIQSALAWFDERRKNK